MEDRIPGGYDNFVIPFLAGMAFILAYCIAKLIGIIMHMPSDDRKKLLLSLVNPRIIAKNIADIFSDCLLHVKIFRKNPKLGYMHMSIAFGWFMLIVIGHMEVAEFMPEKLHTFYYPIFFNYFVLKTADSGTALAVYEFLMDFFLLMVLSGVGIAVFKRFRSSIVGMKRTTRPLTRDRIAMYALWAIFPLRLIAEASVAGTGGGGFLAMSIYKAISPLMPESANVLPIWWAYSISLGIFFFMLPYSRYMHIPTEAVLIMFRNAGIRATNAETGFSLLEQYSCSTCGMCIDACPMTNIAEGEKNASVYFIRNLRYGGGKSSTKSIANACLMCNKCVAACPVGINSCELKRRYRSADYDGMPARQYGFVPSMETHPATIGNTAGNPCMEDHGNRISASYAIAGTKGQSRGVDSKPHKTASCKQNEDNVYNKKAIYFSGCMTQLTPSVSRSMERIFKAAGIDYSYMDRDGGLCCGRPLMLAGNDRDAASLIEKNTGIIETSGAEILVLSCPICYKVFKENYRLGNIRIMHHTEYINGLIESGRIKIRRTDEKLAYHDPCELGRGCGIYDEPRKIISAAGHLAEASENRESSICCGGSLGSITLTYDQRSKVTQAALESLACGSPDRIVTACPLCLKTFGTYSALPVEDIAFTVARSLEN